MGDKKERIAAQLERIIEKLQIRSIDDLTETAVRLASRGPEKLKEEGAAYCERGVTLRVT